MALQIGAFSYSQEITERISFMVYLKHQVPLKTTYWNWCWNRKLQTELISDKELQKTSKQVWESICKQ
jgi:hypothetical protein